MRLICKIKIYYLLYNPLIAQMEEQLTVVVICKYQWVVCSIHTERIYYF